MGDQLDHQLNCALDMIRRLPPHQVILTHTLSGFKVLTLRRPKQHRAQAPDVPDLAQTVKPWSDLFKIFRNVFAGA